MDIFSKNLSLTDAQIIAALHADKSDKPITEQLFFESVSDDAVDSAIARSSAIIQRTHAAAAVVTWIDEDDSDFEHLDTIVLGLIDTGHEHDELDDDELDDYNQVMNFVAEMLVAHGADAALVETMIHDENDVAAEEVFEAVEKSIKRENPHLLIANFAVREALITESFKKVVRDGKAVMIKVSRKVKKHLSALQKAALKKARRFAHTSSAKAHRAKSMRLSKQIHGSH